MLTWLFIQQKDYKKALRQVKALDRHLKENGAPVYNLALVPSRDKDYETAIDAFDYIVAEKGPASSFYIDAKREGEVFGTHIVKYKSQLDTIELYHEAHTRDGFAQGAITAAKWLIGKQGIFGMQDLLGL